MKTANRQKILVILGPTATGKSDLAIKLAKKYRGEVISADSRQVYKGLDIGTGKITEKEMQGVHHWLIDVVSPKKTFTVADWKKLSEEKIAIMKKRSKLPIICGGTGFYIQSIVDGLVLPEVPPDIKLRKKLETKSLEELVSMLKKLDPERLKNIDQKNPVRLIRAIEIAKSLGKVPKIKMEKSQYDFLQIGLDLPEEDLKKKIYNRLKKRINSGMIEEISSLHKKGLSWDRMNELGLEYRYIAQYLQKKISKDQMIEKLNTEIYKYSKRQKTWFKRDKNIKWFNLKDARKIDSLVSKFLKNE